VPLAEVRAGRNPVQRNSCLLVERPNFETEARDYIEAMKPSWKSAKQAAIWEQNITGYCAPLLPLAVDEVDTDHILAVLKSLWSRIPETASRARGRIEAILDAAKARGLRSGENPARWKGHLALRFAILTLHAPANLCLPPGLKSKQAVFGLSLLTV
jgi:hypothetical protein